MAFIAVCTSMLFETKSQGIRSMTASGCEWTNLMIPSKMPIVIPPLAAGESIQPMKGSSRHATMIDGRRIVTGKLPRFFFSALSAKDFEKV